MGGNSIHCTGALNNRISGWNRVCLRKDNDANSNLTSKVANPKEAANDWYCIVQVSENSFSTPLASTASSVSRSPAARGPLVIVARVAAIFLFPCASSV